MPNTLMHRMVAAIGPCALLAATALGQVGKDTSWTKAPWTESDAPYNSIRKEVESARAIAMEKGDYGPISRLVAAYRLKQKAKPKSLTALFGFVACVHAATNLGKGGILGGEDSRKAYAALLEVPTPKSAEFARMRWLLIQDDYRGFRELGERLLKRDPKDFEVVFFLIYQYLNESQPDLVKRGAELADSIVRTFPDKASAYAAKGDFNYLMSFRTKDWLSVRAAREAYKKYLELAPAWLKEGRAMIAQRLANVEEKIRTGDITAWKHK